MSPAARRRADVGATAADGPSASPSAPGTPRRMPLRCAARAAPAPAPPVLGAAPGAFPRCSMPAPAPGAPAGSTPRTPTGDLSGAHRCRAARRPPPATAAQPTALPPVPTLPFRPAAPADALTGTFPATAAGRLPPDRPASSGEARPPHPSRPDGCHRSLSRRGSAFLRPRPGRSPTGTFPAMPPAIPPEGVEGWGAAVPFELAPPGETRPPVQAAQPLSSTFSILRAELAETNALRIYAEGARAGATGLFFFDLPDRTITIYLRRGSPESAESTHADDAIGPFLAANRLATTEQVSKAEREALKYGNDVLAALFTLGFVNPGLVFPALAQRAAALLLHAYLAPKGSFRFESVDLPAEQGGAARQPLGAAGGGHPAGAAPRPQGAADRRARTAGGAARNRRLDDGSPPHRPGDARPQLLRRGAIAGQPRPEQRRGDGHHPPGGPAAPGDRRRLLPRRAAARGAASAAGRPAPPPVGPPPPVGRAPTPTPRAAAAPSPNPRPAPLRPDPSLRPGRRPSSPPPVGPGCPRPIRPASPR